MTHSPSPQQLTAPLLSEVANRSDGTSATKRKLIVVGAHPDDPETGCGGTMRLWSKAGHDVVAAYLTRGEAGIPDTTHAQAAAIRAKESEAACNILEARPVFLGQIDGACEITPQRLEETRRFLEEESPDVVLTHWPIDTHPDHQICALLVYNAWLRLPNRFALYYFEVMTGEQSQMFSPTEYVDIESVLAEKHAACFSHTSQKLKETYADIHGAMEVRRGREARCNFAEAYLRHA